VAWGALALASIEKGRKRRSRAGSKEHGCPASRYRTLIKRANNQSGEPSKTQPGSQKGGNLKNDYQGGNIKRSSSVTEKPTRG